jgi:hypothetical protein
MQWLMVNPEKPLGDCALHFNVSQPWLSTIIHSDVFQAKYQKLLGDQYDERVLPLRDKLIGLSHLALDRLAEKVSLENDPKVLTDVVRSSTRALGMGVGGTTVKMNMGDGARVQIMTAVPPDEIAAARARYIEHCRANNLPLPADGAAPIEGEAVHVAPTEA